MKISPAMKRKNATWTKCLQTVAKVEEIFPLTTPEIAEAQKANDKLKHCFKRNAVLDKWLDDVSIFDDTHMVCKDGRMIIPKPLQRHAVLWFHHYLQHPGHTQLMWLSG